MVKSLHYYKNMVYMTYLDNIMDHQPVFMKLDCHLHERSPVEVSRIAPNDRGYLGHSDKLRSSSTRGIYENILLCVNLVWYMGGIKTISVSIEITGIEIELLKHYGRRSFSGAKT